MKPILFLLLLVGLIQLGNAQAWQPAGDKIKTSWSERLDVNHILSEYPRPAMKRGDWTSLNGLWDYAITDAGAATPIQFDGQILVPFAVESSLSGVQKRLGHEKELWYQRDFMVPKEWKGQRVLLHFGAVDWKTDIWVNDIKVGSHKGGYTPFSFDISPFLNTNGHQRLMVRVWDPTDKGYQPRGKQVSNPQGIWYTPVSGIWQTVWLEPVAVKYITAVRRTPDIDRERIGIALNTAGTTGVEWYEAIVLDGNTQLVTGKAAVTEALEMVVKDAKLWSPESPFLYQLKINLYSRGKIVDQVDSYFAMRKVSKKRDQNGIVRLQLNNKDYFQFGPLDQGWWPDGLYTAPSDDALKYDIIKTKELGFNMIRKHVKVEPARWYYHCDREGMLVWQDMPSGDKSPQWQMKQYFDGTEMIRSAESEENYRQELKELVDYLYSSPCVICWVPFNEAWGQFKTTEITEWLANYDPSRLINPASGGNFYPTGDILDLHNYPGPALYLFDGQRANVLGEYGGIGLPLEGHLWDTDKNWGYVQFKSSDEVTDRYIQYAEELLKLIKAGFSAAVYTQTTDVESEVNGLITYDRKVIKVDLNRVREMNQKICKSLDN